MSFVKDHARNKHYCEDQKDECKRAMDFTFVRKNLKEPKPHIRPGISHKNRNRKGFYKRVFKDRLRIRVSAVK